MVEHSIIDRLIFSVKDLGLGQLDLAKATGVHQSQISRILSGKVRRLSKNVLKLSSHVENLHKKNANNDGIPKVLLEAIHYSWDGTPGHADALARVIVSLKQLGMPQRSVL